MKMAIRRWSIPVSIERVDFGEAQDEKSFVIAHVQRGKTQIERRALPGRRFIDRSISITSPETCSNSCRMLCRPRLTWPKRSCGWRLITPRELDPYLDEQALRGYTEAAFEFHLVRRPQMQTRLRLPGDVLVSS